MSRLCQAAADAIARACICCMTAWLSRVRPVRPRQSESSASIIFSVLMKFSARHIWPSSRLAPVAATTPPSTDALATERVHGSAGGHHRSPAARAPNARADASMRQISGCSAGACRSSARAECAAHTSWLACRHTSSCRTAKSGLAGAARWAAESSAAARLVSPEAVSSLSCVRAR